MTVSKAVKDATGFHLSNIVPMLLIVGTVYWGYVYWQGLKSDLAKAEQEAKTLQMQIEQTNEAMNLNIEYLNERIKQRESNKMRGKPNGTYTTKL